MFEQPRLSYTKDDLAPIISNETITYHYGKHEKSYIDRLNILVSGTEYEGKTLEEIIKTSSGAIYVNASQTWNHIFYFGTLQPKKEPNEPKGLLRSKMEETFGGVGELKHQIETAGEELLGSGWIWLSKDKGGELIITQGANASNPMTEGYKPLLCIDVWEHAYYLDYQNRRAEYLHKIWGIVDWRKVENRYLERNDYSYFSHK